MTRLSPLTRAALGVFGILVLTLAYVWQSRDWNSASRLMLTYALADRGTIVLDGLDTQTGDKAFTGGHYYSDKGPGYSLVALIPYGLGKTVFGLPPHPLGIPGRAHWPADYWVTLGTSGLATAASGALLTLLAGRFGASTRAAVVVGLAYGLATPALVYGTLAYGHQCAAFALLAAFALGEFEASRRAWWGAWLAGTLLGLAVLIELSAAPPALVLGLWFLGRSMGAVGSIRPLFGFLAGAGLPAIVLLSYNSLAFGSPLDLAYRYHVIPRFRAVHSRTNPIGLATPDWSRLPALLWGEYRGLFIYAPIAVLAPIGAILACRRGRALTSLVCTLVVGCGLLTNLSYPEWTGGWSTGPRLLVTTLPFALLAVALALAVCSWLTGPALVLLGLGLAVNLLCLGVGGRLRDEVNGVPLDRPLSAGVVPLWTGRPIPSWWIDDRFARNLGGLAWDRIGGAPLPADLRWLEFLPLFVVLAVAVPTLLVRAGRRTAGPESPVRPPEPLAAGAS